LTIDRGIKSNITQYFTGITLPYHRISRGGYAHVFLTDVYGLYLLYNCLSQFDKYIKVLHLNVHLLCPGRMMYWGSGIGNYEKWLHTAILNHPHKIYGSSLLTDEYCNITSTCYENILLFTEKKSSKNTAYYASTDILIKWGVDIKQYYNVTEVEPNPIIIEKKILLIYRNSFSRKILNLNETESALKKYGNVKCIEPQYSSLKEQIIFFNEADIVIGAHGAAFTNLIYMRPNISRLIEIFPYGVQLHSLFKILAEKMSIKYDYSISLPIEKGLARNDIKYKNCLAEMYNESGYNNLTRQRYMCLRDQNILIDIPSLEKLIIKH